MYFKRFASRNDRDAFRLKTLHEAAPADGIKRYNAQRPAAREQKDTAFFSNNDRLAGKRLAQLIAGIGQRRELRAFFTAADRKHIKLLFGHRVLVNSHRKAGDPIRRNAAEQQHTGADVEIHTFIADDHAGRLKNEPERDDNAQKHHG